MAASEEDYRCRICLATEVNELISMFCIASTQNMLISHMTLACTGVPISTRDEMPQHICDECLGNMDVAYACWRKAREAWGNYKRAPTLRLNEEDYRCRICLKDEVEELISLFCLCDTQQLKISEIIERFAGITVDVKDRRPQYVCNDCLADLNVGFDIRKRCRKSTEKLRFEKAFKPIVVEKPRPVPAAISYKDDEDPDWVDQNESADSSDDEPISRKKTSTKSPFNQPKETKNSTAKKSTPEPLASKRGRPPNSREMLPPENRISFSDPAVLRQLAAKIIAAGKAGGLNSNTIVVDENFTQWKASVFQKQINTGNITLKSAPEITIRQVFCDDGPKVGKASGTKNDPKNESKTTMLALQRIKTIEDDKWKQYIRCQILSVNCLVCSQTYNNINAVTLRCSSCKLSFGNYSQLIPFIDKRKGELKSYCCKKCGFLAAPLEIMQSHIKSKHSTAKKPTVIRPIAMYEVAMDLPMTANANDDADPLEMKCEPETDTEIGPGDVDRKRRLSANNSQDQVPSAAKQSKTISSAGKNQKQLRHNVKKIKDSPYDSRFAVEEDCENYTLLKLDGIVCCDCRSIQSSQEDMDLHKQTHNLYQDEDGDDDEDDEHMCKFCSKRCANLQEVYKHHALAARKLFFYCKLCDFVLWTDEDYEEHFDNFHLSEETETVRIDDTNDEPVDITSMNKRIFDILLETDRYIFLMLKGHKCCGCEVVYQNKSSLLKHCIEHETSEEPSPSKTFGCRICKQRFKSKCDLQQHELKQVTRLYYSCSACHYALVQDETDIKTHFEEFHNKRKITVTSRALTLPQSLLVTKTNRNIKLYFP
ncbi:zinc finger protein 271-like [Uranotaenia lowii]|uniref:zinc finger protein 271-like n=1 Tax=Uranotaenia lowii TaxID=190385 RepID=UPI0024783E8B|nr:zinc finger protein 271-like [Uranotaenia lowii]